MDTSAWPSLALPTLASTLLLALALDAWLGEPRRWHPLVGFGRWAQAIEQRLWRDHRTAGLLAWMVAVLPWVALAWGLQTLEQQVYATHLGRSLAPSITGVIGVWLAVGWTSLEQHASQVHRALQDQDLPAARAAVGRIVSRDTTHLDEAAVAGATVESVLENTCDAITGALFWFIVLGLPGVILYRLANTLDAMWGYRTPRYRAFGTFAARTDDVLNWLPARLTALTFAATGQTRRTVACWRRQGGRWKSPCAGPVMAAGAGRLGIRLGGAATYHGQRQRRPLLGLGRRPRAHDIERALRLTHATVLIWAMGMFAGVVALHSLEII